MLFLPRIFLTQNCLLELKKAEKKIKEVPAIVNEIRPSVSVIYKRIPRTLKSLLKLKIIFYKESLKRKIYKVYIL